MREDGGGPVGASFRRVMQVKAFAAWCFLLLRSGIQVSHPDLAPVIWNNPTEVAGGDDGNSYIDDINGWDFHNNDASVYDNTDDDHGTHVSQTLKVPVDYSNSTSSHHPAN